VEQGFPDLSVAAGYNLFLAPARTPAPIVKKLEEALEKALQDKATRERVEKTELTPDFMNSHATQALLDNEMKKWAPVVKKASIVVK
jgi:tripartite-type tricarboxylate transporter receptor subunit TctC